jgi:hypothetical protein
VKGRVIESNRYGPGWLGPLTKETGGAAVANQFVVGQRVLVYFDPNQPERCCLIRGLSKFGLIFFLIVDVTVVTVVIARVFRISKPNPWPKTLIISSVTLGFALGFFAPPVVVPADQFAWWLLAWFTLIVVIRIYLEIRNRRRTAETS